MEVMELYFFFDLCKTTSDQNSSKKADSRLGQATGSTQYNNFWKEKNITFAWKKKKKKTIQPIKQKFY